LFPIKNPLALFSGVNGKTVHDFEKPMNISLNGESRDLEGPLTLRELLNFLRIPANGAIAVLLNGEVARRAKWEEIIVRPEDEIEIVRATVGG